MHRLALACLLAVGCTPAAPTPAPPAVGQQQAPAGPDAKPAPTGVRVENPTYTRWANFPVGTTVVQKSVTEETDNPNKTVTIIKFTLVEKTDTNLTLELKTTTNRFDGGTIDNPPDRLKNDRYYYLPAGSKDPAADKPAGPTEKVVVGPATYDATVITSEGRNEGGVVNVKTWMSDAVPGGLVKSLTEVPGVKKRVTIELVEVKTP